MLVEAPLYWCIEEEADFNFFHSVVAVGIWSLCCNKLFFFAFSWLQMWAPAGVSVNPKKHLSCDKSIWTCVFVSLHIFLCIFCFGAYSFVEIFICFLCSVDCSGGFCSRDEEIPCKEEHFSVVAVACDLCVTTKYCFLLFLHYNVSS